MSKPFAAGILLSGLVILLAGCRGGEPPKENPSTAGKGAITKNDSPPPAKTESGSKKLVLHFPGMAEEIT
jgi:hypothetical protein